MLAFAITVHKSQGLSLQSVIVDAGDSTFGCGMVYVALSRVTSLNGLYLIDLNRQKIQCDQKAIQEYNRLRQMYTPHLGMISEENSTAKPQPNKPKDKRSKRPISDDKQHVPHKKRAVETTQATTGNNLDVTLTRSDHQSIYNHCHIASIDADFQRTTSTALDVSS